MKTTTATHYNSTFADAHTIFICIIAYTSITHDEMTVFKSAVQKPTTET